MANQMEGFLSAPLGSGGLADLQAGADAGHLDQADVDAARNQAYMVLGMEQNMVEAAQDFRFYLRYRF